MTGIFGGIEVHVVPWLTPKRWTQVRFPRSKKRRIRKKWSKNRRNFAVIETNLAEAYTMGGRIYVSQPMYEKLKQVTNLDRVADLLSQVR